MGRFKSTFEGCELLRDLICEKNPSTNRKNIIFENVYENNGYVMAPYRTLIWSHNFSVSVDEYELRLKQKERDKKLDSLI